MPSRRNCVQRLIAFSPQKYLRQNPPQFLVVFGMVSLRDLPNREQLEDAGMVAAES